MPAISTTRSDPQTVPHASLDITVLLGGPSAERDVSLASGAAIADALERRGHRVARCDISPADLSALDRECNVVFPALHGTFGEDGQLQAILESRGVPFVGSGSRASALAMDKVATKRAAIAIGIPTAEYVVAERRAAAPARDDTGPMPFAPAAVVKPVDQGSSVLTAVVRDAAAYGRALRDVLEAYGRALIERFIDGDEITIGILGRRTLPPICIRPKRGFYDYGAKYGEAGTEYLFDTGHPAALLGELERMSLHLFERLGCRHLARVDWIVDRERRPWLLEVNTLPGFTSHSLVPKAAARAGVPFDELCDRLARMALEDRP